MVVPFIDQQTIIWILLPLAIFCARVADMSLDTLRVVFVSKGVKNLAPIIGFIEILIWLFAIGQIMQNLNNLFCMLAYAAGFAAGNFVGMLIEERLSLGEVLIRIISKHNISEMKEQLEKSGYHLTSVSAEGEKGAVQVILLITHRKNIAHAMGIVKKLNPDTFYTIEEIKSVSEGSVYQKKSIFSLQNLKLFSALRKVK
jgi:uncharacterized protein YebE (UPF0316 family)